VNSSANTFGPSIQVLTVVYIACLVL
jgi:hypothetical protein